ncbi:MAG: DUF5397 family protein [Capsulimonadaceae bacterium]
MLTMTKEAPPKVPIGKIKTFGEFGPKYEVHEPLRQLDNGEWMVRITLVETGEETEYRYTHLLQDPEAS